MSDVQIKKFRSFCNITDKIYTARCRIQSKLINKVIKRNKWLKIRNNETKKSIYRQAQGSTGFDCTKDFTKDAIEFDYDSSLELGLKNNKKINEETHFRECNITIKPANFIEAIIANYNHPDYSYNIGFKLGILSVILGMVSLIK